jgi:hypothetical protein
MRIVRYVASAGVFACKLAALAVGLSWLVVLPQGRWDRPPGAPGEATPALAAGPAADVNVIRMKPAEGRPFAFYSLQDEAGNELARVTYSPRGLVVNLGEALPSRPGLSAQADGSCDFVVMQDRVHYLLKLRPGGTSGLLVLDDRRGVRAGLGVTRDGRIVHDPSDLD